MLAWNSIRCALAADRAAQSLRVPYGLVMLGLEYFQKPAARQKLSERGRLELKLVGEALANADLIALGSQAMHEAANQLLPATRDAVILPPLPLPAGPARKAAAPEVDAALAALENKVVIALTEDAPDPALARRIIDVYAEIALRFPNVVFLALSGGRAAAAMHRHAVSIGLHEEQMVFVSEITDLPSREQLLSHIDLALFPYIPAQGEMPPLPATAALLECMAHGICPAAGLSPAYSELIETGHDGLQVDYSQSASEVAARLLEALGEPARLHAMGKRARERVQRQYPPLEQALDEFMTQAAQPQPASPGVRRAEPRLMRLKTP
ncbi:glycosyltransferase [Achromobacter sp. DMS1]|uniref:glycosyltransferase n=1 Tax=Achromobacter sp. DMS1 TaxID=1688405 RepID=UPI00069ED228|nr:glycosyltransferase [Achromobacter sp. DMS1]